MSIPNTYPQQPPTANFRTSIFHPNVDPQTGGVCVETLKRDWDSNLTLGDVLVTISCLLIQPNPDSALNADAGALIQENYESFAARAKLMTNIHAAIPKDMLDDVKAAQSRGQNEDVVVREDEPEQPRLAREVAAPARRRPVTSRQRGTARSRRSNGSPSGAAERRRRPPPAGNPFVVHPRNDDVFGSFDAPRVVSKSTDDDDSSMLDADQENDESRSPVKASTPKATTPRRPPGAGVPLGELTLEDGSEDSSDNASEQEYPPSPRKSPRKSPTKLQSQPFRLEDDATRPESSHMAAARVPNITPPTNFFKAPLAQDSPFVSSSMVHTGPSPSPRKQKGALFTPGPIKAPLFSNVATPPAGGGIFRQRSPSSAEKKREEDRRRAELKRKLWDLCGQDVERWNRGDFDGEPFNVKARRW